MFRLARLLALALLWNLFATSGLMAADWQVVKVVGLVWVVGVDMEPQRATAGMILPDNATVATTSRSRALLRHGEDILNLGPDTHVAPQARPVHGLTTVLMRQGDLDLDIEHRAQPHFSVQTPFLAAVVKGTRFRVSVHGRDAAVAVRTGRVQVTAFAAHKAVDVTDGQKAEVKGEHLQLSGDGALSVARDVAAETPLVEAAADDAGMNSGADTDSAASVDSSAPLANGVADEAAAAVVDAAAAVDDTKTDNAGGNSANSNAGGNSANSNSGSGNNNAGGNGNGNSGNSNAGGNGKGKGKSG